MTDLNLLRFPIVLFFHDLLESPLWNTYNERGDGPTRRPQEEIVRYGPLRPILLEYDIKIISVIPGQGLLSDTVHCCPGVVQNCEDPK